MDNKKIYEALRTIQRACYEYRDINESCQFCPLANNYVECLITPEDGEAPLNWNLVSPDKAVRLLQ